MLWSAVRNDAVSRQRGVSRAPCRSRDRRAILGPADLLMTWNDALFLDLRVRWRALLWSFRRRNLRNNEIALMVASAVLGVAIGLGIAAVQLVVQQIHQLTFAIAPGDHLSESNNLDWWRVLA